MNKYRKSFCRMKIITVLTVGALILAAVLLTAFVYAAEEKPDFIINGTELNIKACDLLSLEGCFTYDQAQFTRNAYVVISSNDGADIPKEVRGTMLMNGGRGDRYSFSVDFGDIAIDSFSFYSYGLAAKSSRLSVSIDGVSVGEAEAPGGNGWADYDPGVWIKNTIALSAGYSGVHDIVLTVTDSADEWPANAIGNFSFSGSKKGPDFVMNEPELHIYAKDLLSIPGCFDYDESKYTRNAGVVIGCNDGANIPEEIRGQMLLHGGCGDSYTFTVDFGEREVDSFGFYSYGAASKPSRVGIDIDGVYIGDAEAPDGNGWADADSSVWFYNEIKFNGTYKGVHKVVIRITDSAPAWPADAVGNFIFFEKSAVTEPDTSEETTEFVPVPETTEAETTEAETTEAETTEAETTEAETTEAEITEAETTEAETTGTETTEAEITGAITTEAITTGGVTTEIITTAATSVNPEPTESGEAQNSGCGGIVGIITLFIMISGGAYVCLKNGAGK